MRMIVTLIALLTGFALSAQEKGVTPVPSTVHRPPSTVTYAVVVGISNYQDKDIPDLRFADRDAEAFANFLRSPAGGSLDNDHLKVLLNDQATAGRIAEALDGLIEQAKEGDQVIIYFSGHGDVERKTVTQPGFLLAWDAPSRVYMGGGTYSLAFLQEIVTTLSTQNLTKVIVITDACHAGKLAGSQLGGAQLTSANLAKQYANEVKILSCQPNEFSLEGEQWGGGRGAFSYHLVDGLFGLADRNGDGTVTVGEIDRYLEDHVTAEAAPQSQVPMLLGSKTERLATVSAAILAELKKAKTGGMPVFATTESRGLEDDVLTTVDTSIREKYFAFKRAVKEKRFFAPPENVGEAQNLADVPPAADVLYAQLIKVEALAPLRGVMTRNYAAALQDDAQQVLNTMLKTGLTEEILIGTDAATLYGNYHHYLQRAAELLGAEHYMYKTLQARKYFFLGKIQKSRLEARKAFHQALQWQPDMPHTYTALINTFEYGQVDSAEYYASKANELLPFWVEPYIQLSIFYKYNRKLDKAEEMLEKAGQLDSSSVLVWYRKGAFYASIGDYKNAEIWLLKSIEVSGADICFPCAYNSLGYAYLFTGRFEEAERMLLHALRLDSTHVQANLNLGNVYGQTGRLEQAERYLLKTIQFDSSNASALSNLGIVCAMTGRIPESVSYFEKTIAVDSTFLDGYANLAGIYAEIGRFEESEKLYLKMIGIDPNVPFIYFELGDLYLKMQRYEEAEARYKQATQLGPKIPNSWIGLGKLYLTTGRQEAAKTALDKATELSPNNAGVYVLLSRWAIKADQIEQAWQYLEQALKIGAQSGRLPVESLQMEPDFETLRKQEKWEELMQKYFTDQVKD